MKLRKRCISCGFMIFKSGRDDLYICRDCEKIGVGEKTRYAYLDSMQL